MALRATLVSGRWAAIGARDRSKPRKSAGFSSDFSALPKWKGELTPPAPLTRFFPSRTAGTRTNVE
jgi:hypothetical protein